MYDDIPTLRLPDFGRVRLLGSLFDLLERSVKGGLYLHIYGGPKTIGAAFARHAICDRLTALDIDINMNNSNQRFPIFRSGSMATEPGQAFLLSCIETALLQRISALHRHYPNSIASGREIRVVSDAGRKSTLGNLPS